MQILLSQLSIQQASRCAVPAWGRVESLFCRYCCSDFLSWSVFVLLVRICKLQLRACLALLSLLISSKTLRYWSELAESMHTSLSTAISLSLSLHLSLYFARAVFKFCALAFERNTIKLSTLDSMTLLAVPRMPLCALKHGCCFVVLEKVWHACFCFSHVCACIPGMP